MVLGGLVPRIVFDRGGSAADSAARFRAERVRGWKTGETCLYYNLPRSAGQSVSRRLARIASWSASGCWTTSRRMAVARPLAGSTSTSVP